MSTDPPPRESLSESEQNPSAPSSASNPKPWGSSGYAIVAVVLAPPALTFLAGAMDRSEFGSFGALAILVLGSPLAALICACLENRIWPLPGVGGWIRRLGFYLAIEIGLCFGACVASAFG